MNVFLSYQMEDAVYRESFTAQVAALGQYVMFLDYPKVELFDPEWRARCSELIAQCAGTVVLIGGTTYQSQPVMWEIAETRIQGRPVIGVILPTGGQQPSPRGLGDQDLISLTDFGMIVSRVCSWRT